MEHSTVSVFDAIAKGDSEHRVDVIDGNLATYLARVSVAISNVGVARIFGWIIKAYGFPTVHFIGVSIHGGYASGIINIGSAGIAEPTFNPNNNNLLITATANFPVDYPAGSGISLATWNAASGNPAYNLSNTSTQFPGAQMFPGLAAGDLSTTVCRAANAGAPVSVTMDFNSTARSGSAPDIGSVEFATGTGYPAVTSQPANASLCTGNNATFTTSGSGYGISYQWEADQGSGWNALSNGGVYSGVATSTLGITGAPQSMNSYQYRITISGACSPAASSQPAVLSVTHTNIWSGASSTNWGTAANWGCGYIPVATSDVVIANVSNAPIISDGGRVANNLTVSSGGSLTMNAASSYLSVGGTFTNSGTLTLNSGTVALIGTAAQTVPAGSYNDLAIQNPAGVSIAGNVTINDTLRLLAGSLQLGSSDLTMAGNISAISGAASSRYIITNGAGKLTYQNIGSGGRAVAILFPVGAAPSAYTPATLTNAGTLDAFSVRIASGVNTNYNGSGTPTGTTITSAAVNNTWHITEGTAGGSNATLTLQWNAADELAGFSRASSYLAHYNGSTWMSATASAAAGSSPYTQTRSALTSFSPFGVGSGTTLPVAYVAFEGIPVKTDVILSWLTATEINNAYFVVERAMNVKGPWIDLAEIKGVGNSTTITSYGYTDLNVISLPGNMLYYRLRQVDRDGMQSHSSTLAINKQQISAGLSVIPNPFEQLFRVEMTLAVSSTVSMRITDVHAKELAATSIQAQAGAFSYDAGQLADMSAGIYYVEVTINGARNVSKIVKIK